MPLFWGNAESNSRRIYADSSPDAFDDPKIETIVELMSRIWVRHTPTQPVPR